MIIKFIDRFENKVVEQNGRDAKTLKNTLTIKNVAKEDEGTYICRSIAARDMLIGIVEKSVNLRVQCEKTNFILKHYFLYFIFYFLYFIFYILFFIFYF